MSQKDKQLMSVCLSVKWQPYMQGPPKPDPVRLSEGRSYSTDLGDEWDETWILADVQEISLIDTRSGIVECWVAASHA